MARPGDAGHNSPSHNAARSNQYTNCVHSSKLVSSRPLLACHRCLACSSHPRVRARGVRRHHEVGRGAAAGGAGGGARSGGAGSARRPAQAGDSPHPALQRQGVQALQVAGTFGESPIRVLPASRKPPGWGLLDMVSWRPANSPPAAWHFPAHAHTHARTQARSLTHHCKYVAVVHLMLNQLFGTGLVKTLA